MGQAFKKALLVFVAAVLTSLLALGYLGANERVPGIHQAGGMLVWGTANPPTIINPVLTRHGVSSSILELVFNSLVRVNGNDEVVSDLAESWEISPDGRIYTFHLRTGVRFHDGSEMTSEDVKFVYEAIADPHNRSPWNAVGVVNARWEVIDKHSLRMTLLADDPSVLRKLVKGIPPKRLLEGVDLWNAEFNYHPIGTGPFRFRQWDRKAAEILLEANPNYYEGRPRLDGVTIKVYPDNSRLWAAFMRQEVDFVKFLNYADYRVLEKDSAFKTYKVPLSASWAISYDMADPVLSDSGVREAVANAVNVEKIMEGSGMSGIISSGPFQSGAPGFNPSVKAYAYDPAGAARLLAMSGWIDTNGDGVLEKNGQGLEIRMLVESRSEYCQKMAMMIRQQLSEVGIRLLVLPFRDETELTTEYLSRHKPQAWLRMFKSRSYSPEISFQSWYPSREAIQSLWHYSNMDIDELLLRIKGAANKDMQVEAYQKIHAILYRDQPACFLFSPVTFHAVSSRVVNADEFFTGAMPIYVLKDWRLDAPGKKEIKRR